MPAPSIVQPTPYPEVNAILHLLLGEARAILGEELVGMYLFGSLSWGDFDPGSSDIDFLVVTADALPDAMLAALARMHARVGASGLPWATKLEGVYMPRAALRRYDPTNARHPTIGVDWPFGVGQHNSSWIFQLHILRECGIVVCGPSPRTLIDPVTLDELRAVVIDNLRDYWARQVGDPERWRRRDYQAFAILTMCRTFYTLERGEVASKQVGRLGHASSWGRPGCILSTAPWPGATIRNRTTRPTR